MTETTLDLVEVQHEYRQIQHRAHLHWIHWLIIACSLLLTLAAWYLVNIQVTAKARQHFEREADQVVTLIPERMRNYEVALWSAAAAIHSNQNDLSRERWNRFARTLDLKKQYPGINGIGVIFPVAADQVENFVAQQRVSFPEFQIHPTHKSDDYWPITYIEPEKYNRAAIGLDIAHERSRFAAAKAARDSGEAQITGLIELAQNDSTTPGFLFYVPFYKGAHKPDSKDRQALFDGLVYAPFIFSNLMQGVLRAERRPVSVRIHDTESPSSAPLYDELRTDAAEFDSQPVFETTRDFAMYGRTWQFTIATNQRFRAQTSSNESLAILIGGIGIDILLLTLFISLARSNRNALNLAQRVASRYQDKATHLERANAELEEFAYRTSHDMRSPLVSSTGLLAVAIKAIENKNMDRAVKSLAHVETSLHRLATLIEDILSISKANNLHEDPVPLLLGEVISSITQSLAHMEGFSRLRLDTNLDFSEPFISRPESLTRILENLLSNAVKYQNPEEPKPYIKIRAYQRADSLIIDIEDNGLGIPASQHDKMFTMFNRFHPRVSYGTGLGLYMVKKSVMSLNGKISYDPLAHGSLFRLKFALEETHQNKSLHNN